MRESSFELASRLRSEAEALEELFLEGEKSHTFQSRQEEEDRLEDLLGLAQDRLASLRLEALQENMEDVESILRGLQEDQQKRVEEGRPVSLIQSFISIAESERVRLHHIITAAVRAEEESRRLRGRQKARKPNPDVRRSREIAPDARPSKKARKKASQREVVDSA
ncbi:MAG: hypothetical protein AB7S38_07570 [Vulcanimicrobiota bacterium]